MLAKTSSKSAEIGRCLSVGTGKRSGQDFLEGLQTSCRILEPSSRHQNDPYIIIMETNIKGQLQLVFVLCVCDPEHAALVCLLFT